MYIHNVLPKRSIRKISNIFKGILTSLSQFLKAQFVMICITFVELLIAFFILCNLYIVWYQNPFHRKSSIVYFRVIRFPLNSFKRQPNKCVLYGVRARENFFSKRDKTRHTEKMVLRTLGRVNQLKI